ncbi:Hsp70 family protein [Catenuloplanes atrovinosus]|uniref:Uncharacterized protein n=1 Tax=Catenuloplanes atrovinosus TaxID=137266 RepID=A0AAE3YMK9_9ACTN|nr:Hsp70 family protein [Catenuloplanes atrovinosus]MDR7275260.1 hypothetical protein [Catenuloplanes atrovinosus]
MSSTAAVAGDGTAILFDGLPLLPSGICAAGDRLITGSEALGRAGITPDAYEPHPKRFAGVDTVPLGAFTFPVPKLIGAVLARAAEEAAVTTGETVTELVLTHPVSWGADRCGTLVAAAREAGLPTPELVPEPVAAGRALGGVPVAEGAAVLVCDFGGGSFGATVLRRTGDGYQVAATETLADAGGLALDGALLTWLATSVPGEAGWQRLLSPTSSADRRAARRLRDDVRQAKEALSGTSSATVRVPLLDQDVVITRQRLEAVAGPILERAVAASGSALRAAGAVPAAVVMIGGGGRMPLAATLLHRALQVPPVLLADPELAIARGGIGGYAARAGSPGAARMPGTAGVPAQPGFPGSVAGPGVAGAAAQPGFPGNVAGPGVAGAAVQPGFPGSVAGPGVVGAAAQPGFPGNVAGPGVAGAAVQPGFPGSVAGPGAAGAATQPGHRNRGPAGFRRGAGAAGLGRAGSGSVRASRRGSRPAARHIGGGRCGDGSRVAGRDRAPARPAATRTDLRRSGVGLADLRHAGPWYTCLRRPGLRRAGLGPARLRHADLRHAGLRRPRVRCGGVSGGGAGQRDRGAPLGDRRRGRRGRGRGRRHRHAADPRRRRPARRRRRVPAAGRHHRRARPGRGHHRPAGALRERLRHRHRHRPGRRRGHRRTRARGHHRRPGRAAARAGRHVLRTPDALPGRSLRRGHRARR